MFVSLVVYTCHSFDLSVRTQAAEDCHSGTFLAKFAFLSTRRAHLHWLIMKKRSLHTNRKTEVTLQCQFSFSVSESSLGFPISGTMSSLSELRKRCVCVCFHKTFEIELFVHDGGFVERKTTVEPAICDLWPADFRRMLPSINRSLSNSVWALQGRIQLYRWPLWRLCLLLRQLVPYQVFFIEFVQCDCPSPLSKRVNNHYTDLSASGLTNNKSLSSDGYAPCTS